MCSEPKSNGKIARLLERLDGSGSNEEWAAVGSLRELLGAELPNHLLAKYKTQRSWKPRSAYVYHSVRYARNSDAAVELGKLAIEDKSKAVRYRGCMLLAYSLRKDLLPFIQKKMSAIDSKELKKDLVAAADAIAHGNHNYFVDRDHSGNVTLNIQ